MATSTSKVTRGRKRKSTDTSAPVEQEAKTTTKDGSKTGIAGKVSVDAGEYAEKMRRAVERINAEVKTKDGDPLLQFMEGGSSRWDPHDVIPTGCLALDMAIGIGGLPRGRFIEVYGKESAGKTTLCLHAAANAQKMGVPVLFLDAEQAYDKVYAQKLGVDASTMAVDSTGILDDAINNMLSQMRLIKEETGEGPLIIVDSVSALTTRAQHDKDAGQKTMGEVARMWSENLSKLAKAAAQTQSTIIFINQVRAKLGSFFASEDTTGGKALKFYFSLRIEVSRKGEFNGEDSNGKKKFDGQEMTFVLKKNKVSSPYASATVYLPKNKPFDSPHDIIDSAIAAGVVISGCKATIGKDGLIHLDEKSNYYAYIISDEEAEYLNSVMPVEVEQKRALEQKRAAYAQSIGRSYTPQEIPDWEELKPGDCISAYQKGSFKNKIFALPELLTTMEQRTLNTLSEPDNCADRFISPESVALKNLDSAAYGSYGEEWGDLGTFEFDS